MTLHQKMMVAAVNQLIVEGTFSVARKGKDYMLIKMIAKRPFSVFLRNMDEGFCIEPPKHEFSCRHSHFEFRETEQRFTRQKNILIQLVAALKKTGVWDYILNQTFFMVNKANSKMNEGAVEEQYDIIMNGPGKISRKRVKSALAKELLKKADKLLALKKK